MSQLDSQDCAVESPLHHGVTAEKIVEAHRQNRHAVIATEVRDLTWLQRLIGAQVLGKFENQQRTGSFKFRGAYERLRTQEKTRPVVAASAGNHGLAIADCAQLLGLNATICIPTTASPIKKTRLAGYGHSIVQQGSSLEEATEFAKHIAEKSGADFVSPYNNRDIICGQGTTSIDFLNQVGDLDVLIVPVGGGGLIGGMGLMAKHLNPTLRVIGVEPEKYASLTHSLRGGQIERVINAPTFADGLAVNLEPGSITFSLAQEVVDETVLVSEEEIAAATLALLNHESQLVEPAGAVGLAALLAGKVKVQDGCIVGLVLSGGNLSVSNLSKIINYPFRDPKLLEITRFHGEQASHCVVMKGVDFSAFQDREKTDESTTSQDEVSIDTNYWNGRFDHIREIIARMDIRLGEYSAYCSSEGLRPDQSAVTVVANFCKDAQAIIDENKINLEECSNSREYNAKITELLQKYRALLHMALSASMALDWRSASYGQSWDTMFFGLDSQGHPGVNYNRYESGQLVKVEKMMAEVLAVDQTKAAVLMTSSGMAAYNLIQSYLFAEVLRPGDSVLIPQYIYFETEEQIAKTPWLNIIKSSIHDVESIVELVKEHKPRVIFLDPLTNTVDLRMTDVAGAIKALDSLELEDDLYVVVDGTMMPGECRPWEATSSGSKVKVLYYDSCSKYTQLGLDIAMGGLVAPPVELGPLFERQRRNNGAIMYDSASNIFPQYSRETHSMRMRRFTRNAQDVGEFVLNDDSLKNIVEPHFPKLQNHPDAELSNQFESVGGVMSFTFCDAALNQRDSLNSFIEVLLAVAREQGVSITKGVSFGFSIPRISAAAAMAENAPPFLRLSVGDRSLQETQLLCIALKEAFIRYVQSNSLTQTHE